MYSQRERTPDTEGPFTALRKHDEYYLPGGDLFFLIEQNHFRVHRYFFERESPFFKAQLATPASPGASRQGTSESTAIVLTDVRAADFAKFLWVFYNPKYSLYHAKVDDWVAILHLACKWGFSEVKALVIREIERLYMTDIHRVVVYHKYDIDRRLLYANYAALVAREQPLTLEEGMELGMDTTLKIFRAREIARSTPGSGGIRSPRSVTLPRSEMKGLVQDLFEITVPDDGDDVEETPVEETQPIKPLHTNGTNGTKTTTNGTGKDVPNPTNPVVNSNATSGSNVNNANGNTTTNGNATKSSTTESTTQKTGAGAGAANADAKATANGTPTPNGVKETTTNGNATSNSTTSSTPNTGSNTGSGDAIFSRLFQPTEPSNAGNGTADAKKNDNQTEDKKKPTVNTEAAKDKDNKDKEEPTPGTPRPETPNGGKNAKGIKGGKKNSWGGF